VLPLGEKKRYIKQTKKSQNFFYFCENPDKEKEPSKPAVK